MTARDDGGTIMAIADERPPIHGVQFHPESILTRHGFRLLANFLDLTGPAPPRPVRRPARRRRGRPGRPPQWPRRLDADADRPRAPVTACCTVVTAEFAMPIREESPAAQPAQLPVPTSAALPAEWAVQPRTGGWHSHENRSAQFSRSSKACFERKSADLPDPAFLPQAASLR